MGRLGATAGGSSSLPRTTKTFWICLPLALLFLTQLLKLPRQILIGG
jgi:hypothetical protein